MHLLENPKTFEVKFRKSFNLAFWYSTVNSLVSTNFVYSNFFRENGIIYVTATGPNSIMYVLICKMFLPLFFYWDCFSLSGLDRYFRCKTINMRYSWRHTCSDDVTLCKNVLCNINFSSSSSFLQELYSIQRGYHQL